MGISLATVGGKITASFLNLIVTAVNRNQSTQVIPTSTAGTGTITTSTGGTVSVTGSGAVRLNGVFTSLYSTYVVVFDFPSLSTSATISARLSAGGTDDVGSNYVTQVLQGSGAAAAAASSGAAASFLIMNTGSVEASGEVWLYAPARTSASRLVATTMGTLSGTSVVIQSSAGRHSLTTGFDGITLTISAGTMLGTISVFGMNNG
jgi:hypothetical protein